MSLSANSFTLGLEFVGVTCAACHVGEFRRNGKAVRVDGATNMLNLQLFYSEAIDAVIALKNGTKLWHALKRLGRQDYERYSIAAPLVRPALLVYAAANAALNWDKVKARLELIQVIDEAKKNRDPNHPTSGFGRLDAFDGTRNFLLTRLRTEDKDGKFEVNRANLVKLDAPVKFPPLWSSKTQAVTATDADPDQPGAFPPVWGFKDFDWVEWTIDTDSVMERNVTETLGAGATVVLEDQGRRAREPLPAAQAAAEPVFGQIKQARGFRQFLLRGFEKVRAEWAIVCTVHSLLKLAQRRNLSETLPMAA